MNSIPNHLVKKLNDRLLTQTVVMQTLMDIIIESGLVTEEDLELRIKNNIESIEESINELQKESSPMTGEELEGLYFGPVGEA